MTFRTITGEFRDITGDLLANTTISVTPRHHISGDGSSVAILGDTTLVTSNGSGVATVNLADNILYEIEYTTSRGTQSREMFVDDEGPWTWGRLIGLAGTASASLLRQTQDARDAAQAARDAAQAARDAAQAAQTGAETAQTGAETSQTAAATSETNAATSETNAAASAASAAADAAGMKHSVVVLTQTNSDGRLIEASVAESRPYPATGYNTIFALQVAGDKTAGSAQVNLSGFATLALNDKSGSAISAADVWLDGDWLYFYRDQTSFQFHLISVNRISASDLPYASDAEALAGVVEKPVKPANLLPLTRNRMGIARDLQPPTSTRPVRVIMPETGRMIWSVRLSDDDYHDSYERSHGDALHVELIDAKLGFSAHSASTEQVWAINAMWATLGGQDVTFANHIWDTIQGDGSAETGGSPSTFEWMESIGLNATSEATINAAGGTGIYHGKIDCTNTLLVVTGGVLNGSAVSDGTDLAATLKAGDVLYCTQFDIQTTATMYADDGTTTVATCTNLLRASESTQILWLPSIAHAADAKVTFGYMAMLPFNGVNRLQGNGTGLTGVQTVTTSGSFGFGEATQVVGWNTNQPGRALAFEINAGYAPLRIDGVQQTWSADRALFVVYDAEKAKLYLSNFQNSTTGDDVSNLTFSTYVTYKAVRANGTF